MNEHFAPPELSNFCASSFYKHLVPPGPKDQDSE